MIIDIINFNTQYYQVISLIYYQFNTHIINFSS